MAVPFHILILTTESLKEHTEVSTFYLTGKGKAIYICCMLIVINMQYQIISFIRYIFRVLSQNKMLIFVITGCKK